MKKYLKNLNLILCGIILVMPLFCYGNSLIEDDIQAKKYAREEKEINDAKTMQESQQRYWTLYNSCCLCNPYYKPVHTIFDDDDTIFPKFSKIKGNVIIDWEENKEIISYGWARMYAMLEKPVKEGAVNNKNITHLLTGPNCEFDSQSVVNNKKLKYIVIDSEIKNIDEDAFQDNPKVQMYHVCCAYLINGNKKYDVAYELERVRGEVDEHVKTKNDSDGGTSIFQVGGAYRDSYVWQLKPFNEYGEIGGVLFTKDAKKLLFYPIGRPDEKYNVPESVVYIGNSAFRNAKNLKRVSVPKTVMEIGDEAFLGTKLTLYVSKGSYAEKYAKEHKIKIGYIK